MLLVKKFYNIEIIDMSATLIIGVIDLTCSIDPIVDKSCNIGKGKYMVLYEQLVSLGVEKNIISQRYLWTSLQIAITLSQTMGIHVTMGTPNCGLLNKLQVEEGNHEVPQKTSM